MDAEKFGAFVAQCRREKNWTQAELAAKLQVTDKAVSRWERGRGFPDIQLLLPLANALGVSVLELMYSEKMEAEKRTTLWDDQAAADLLAGAVEMERKNRRQDRAATAIAAAVTLAVAALLVWSGRASIGGGLLAGGVVSLGAVGFFLYVQSQADREGQRVYGAFLIAGLGGSVFLLRELGVDGFHIAWGLYLLVALLIAALGRKRTG